MKNQITIPEAKTLKYRQIADALREKIVSGVLAPGDRLPSFNQLRAHFGATQSTSQKVFEVLSRENLIVREPNRGIFVAAEKPVAAPRKSKKLKTRTGIVGVSGWGFFDHGNASYWIEVMRGIREAAAQSKMQILLLDPASMNGWEKADGILVCDWTSHEILNRMPPTQPRVSVLVDLPQMATVCADDFKGGFLATQHLLKLGHRKIGFLHGGDLNVIPQRLSGCREALSQAGLPEAALTARYLIGDYHDQNEFQISGRETMRAWLHDNSKWGWKKIGCTALLCHNDAVALGVIEALSTHGRRVPDDVSVVGFDGVGAFPQIEGGLTTIEVPLFEIGAKSVEVLARQIAADEVSNEHRALPVKVKVAGTTAPARM